MLRFYDVLVGILDGAAADAARRQAQHAASKASAVAADEMVSTAVDDLASEFAHLAATHEISPVEVEDSGHGASAWVVVLYANEWERGRLLVFPDGSWSRAEHVMESGLYGYGPSGRYRTPVDRSLHRRVGVKLEDAIGSFQRAVADTIR